MPLKRGPLKEAVVQADQIASQIYLQVKLAVLLEQMKRGDAFGINPIVEEDQSLKGKSRSEKRAIQKKEKSNLETMILKMKELLIYIARVV